MIKATALKPVSMEDMECLNNVLTKHSQNIRIECSQDAERIPQAVEALACKMMLLDADIRGFLCDLRNFYILKRETFQFNLSDLADEAKQEIIHLFKSLYGVLSEVRYCADCDTINGRLIYSSRALQFINGQYMEIAVGRIVRHILMELEEKHQKQFKLYANTVVTTVDGQAKNEFDLLIENVTDSIMYVIEIKSGKAFNDFDKMSRIGKRYGIVPNRLLLIDNYFTTDQMEIIEYFCEYYCANLEQDNLRQKLITMIENDL